MNPLDFLRVRRNDPATDEYQALNETRKVASAPLRGSPAESARPRRSGASLLLGIAAVIVPPLGLVAGAVLLAQAERRRAVAVLLLTGLGLLLWLAYLAYLAYAMMRAYEAAWNSVY